MPMSLAGLPLVDPQSLKGDCDRRGIDTSKWWGKTNAFVVPLHSVEGVMYGIGRCLMTGSVYARLPEETTELAWQFVDPFGRQTTLRKLCLLSTEAVTWSDPSGIASEYMLTLADRRYRLNQVAVGREYNTRGPGGGYDAASLNAGVAWTWNGVVQDIWDKMRAVFPDLNPSAPPFATIPPGTPEGFYFYTEGAWEALWRVAEAGGNLLRYDPTTDWFDMVDAGDQTMAVPRDERGRFVLTNATNAPKPPVWPVSLRVTFPIPGANEREYVEVVVGRGGADGTVEVVADDLPYVGTNLSALEDRADMVLKVWAWSRLAAWANAVEQIQGVSAYARQTLGYNYRTHWAIQDVSGGATGGGVISTTASSGWWKERTTSRLLDTGVIGFVPSCASASGSGGGTGCVVWYTNYLHMEAVAVSVGEVVEPGQLLGYIGYHDGGAHLHFSLGDGSPLIQPGYVVPIAGRTVEVTGWLGFPVVGPRTACERGSMGAAAFTADELAFIEAHFQSPVRGAGWESFIISPFHCDYEYYAVDIAWAPIADQEEVGQPVYLAVTGTDIVSTVESVYRHPAVGFAVLVRHQAACCADPGESGDPHNTTLVSQFPGLQKVISNPPPGTTRPHEPTSFAPVTRICLGEISSLSVLGNFFGTDYPPQWTQLDPDQFEVVNGYLRIKPALLAGSVAASGSGLGGAFPMVVERTKITPPAGTLIGGTVCSPPATTCCDGPAVPCDDFDPILPVVITAPFGTACADAELSGEIDWDNGTWRYEGFVEGLASGVGFLANVQMAKVGADWVLYCQFVGVGDEVLTQFEITLAVVGDVLTGTAAVDRLTCGGTATATVGDPCPVSGSGSGSGGGSGILLDCSLVPGTLTYGATQTGGTACTDFPTSGSAISGSPGVWTFGATTGCLPFPSGWAVELQCDNLTKVYTCTVYENGVAVATAVATVTSSAPFAASAAVTIPNTAACCPNTTWTFGFTA